MKVRFNDATELTVQQVYLDSAGALRIKTISATQEQLKELFSDPLKTAKITVIERGQDAAVYERYTDFTGINAYTAGFLEPFLYREGESPEEEMKQLKKENAALKEKSEMLEACILEMSEVVYQ